MHALLLSDTTGKALLKKEKLLYWLIVAFFATLFLPPEMPVISNVVIAAMIVVCLVYNTPAGKLRLLKIRGSVIFMLLFFLLQIVSAVASVNQSRAWSILAMRSSLLIFPVTIGLITVGRELRTRILLAYAVLITVVALSCLTDAIRRSWTARDMQWLYDDSLTILIGRTSVYMSLLVVIAIFSFFTLLETGFITGKKKWLAGGCIVFLMVFHFLLASRISLFFLYAALAAWVIFDIVKSRSRGRALAAFGGLVLLGAACLILFPKTFNRFRQLRYTGYDYHSLAVESHYNLEVTPDQWNGVNFRLAVWNCGLDMARQHPITGVPLGDKRERLMEEYKARGFTFASIHHRNLHSTWLDVLVNTGIPGLLVFLLGWLVFPVRAAIARKDWLSAGIVAAFATAMITETWIDSGWGSIWLGFWVSLVTAWTPVRQEHPIPVTAPE
ncbi:MAG TPA: O-antigen ligase family protein [Puia sp.]|jgi:O-antigen ligase|nr:O-antigen ligase family protein [Puia sp.]